MTGGARKVVGLRVDNDKNESIGSINDLLTDKSGSIKAAVISVGGFLGVGARAGSGALRQDQVRQRAGRRYRRGRRAQRQPADVDDDHRRRADERSGSHAPAMATPPKPNPRYPDHAVFDATKDELQAMPEFKYST